MKLEQDWKPVTACLVFITSKYNSPLPLLS